MLYCLRGIAMVERIDPNIHIGLNNEQVQMRIKQNLIHQDTMVTTKSIKQIEKEQQKRINPKDN